MNDMKIRAGARLSFNVEQSNPDSVSATFIADDGAYLITDTVDYTDGVAAFQFDSPDTDHTGSYNYQINENFSSGSPDIYPSADGCDGDCDFPVLEICESLAEES